ncbi:MAG: LysE family translocator [Ancalomicrobiaceae bacterium]|nr:LysE family translocator [Ancalomicrobiaceae bacterium]
MPLTTLAASLVAAMLYVLSPGPAVLALIGLGASKGRQPAIRFVTGHLAGDFLWCGLAIFALVSAETIDPRIFGVIALVCASYLGYLGFRSLTATSAKAAENLIGDRPLSRGVVFGLTNPKSYPVAQAMFAALFAGLTGGLTFSSMPFLLTAAFCGFICGNVVLIWLVGTKMLRRLYLARAIWIIRGTGLLFILFALRTFWEGLIKLTG